MGMCSLEVVFVLYTEAGTLKPVTTWTSFLSKVWPRFRRPSSLPAVFQLCCCCYSLPFPPEPHNIPGWSGIVWWMLSISLNVHAEVFLRRRSARDAFYFFYCFYQALLFFYSNDVSSVCSCSVCFFIQFFSLHSSYLFICSRHELLFVRTHTHTYYTWISCLLWHTQPVVMLVDGDLKQKRGKTVPDFT